MDNDILLKSIYEKLETIENKLNNIEAVIDINNKSYLTIKEACEVLSLSRVTILKLIHEGKLKAFKVSGKWLVDKNNIAIKNKDIDSFIMSVL